MLAVNKVHHLPELKPVHTLSAQLEGFIFGVG